MKKTSISKTVGKDDVMEIVKIHKICVRKCNSQAYPKTTIDDWIKTIDVKNVSDQLDSSSWYLLKINNKVCAFGQSDIELGIIYQIQVLPRFQGNGYGLELYKAMLKDFSNFGVDKISLYSTLNALSFYYSLGFKKVKKHRFKLVKEYAEMIEMRKYLNNDHI